MSPFMRALALATVLFAVLTKAGYAQLYWDTNGATVGSGNAGGLWGTDPYWTPDANGLSSTGAYTPGSSVVFAAGTDGVGTYTVTLTASQTAAGLNFQEGHITIAPNTTDFATMPILTLSGTSPTANVQNMNSSITTRISSNGLTKTGIGKLTLNYGASGSVNFFNLGGGAIVINGGTLELAGTGASANQLNASNNIVVNSGGTFLWSSGVNNISDGARITVNAGGTLVTRVNDQIGTLAGSGFLALQNGSINLAMGNNVTVYSGLIVGAGNLQANNGNGSLTLTNVNTFTGSIASQNTNTSTGGIVLGNSRAAQNATITLNNFNVSAINVSFASGIDTFVTGGLTGISKLNLQNASGSAITLQVGNNDLSSVYRGSLGGSGGLTKIGTGILTLAGELLTVTAVNNTSGVSTVISPASAVSHTYTGDTTILAGTHSNSGITSTSASTLKLDFNAQANVVTNTGGSTYTASGVAPSSDIVSSASRLVLGGGRLWMAGNNAGNAATQTFNNTFLLAGRSYVTVTEGTVAGVTLVNLGNITRNVGSILEFTLPGNAQSGATTTTGNDASGILGGWAIIGNEWAVKSTSGTAIGNVQAASAGVYTTYVTGDIVGSTTSNLLINDGTSSVTTGTGITDVNTIMVRNNGVNPVARTIDIGAGETLRLGESGSIWNQGSGALTIGTGTNVGALTSGGALDEDGEVIINNTGGGELTVRSSVTDNGDGVVTLIRAGAGNQVVFAGANTHTGGTVLTHGRTRIDNAAALSTGDVTVMAGATLWLNANATYTNDFYLQGTGYGEASIPGAIRLSTGHTITGTITLTGDTRIGAVNSGSASTLAGKITGDYALDLSGGAAGTNIIVLSNSTNDFTGNFSINTNLNATSAYNTGGSVVTVRLGASEVIPNGFGKGNLIISGGTAGGSGTGIVTLDLNGFSETVNSLISYGTHANAVITNNAAGSTSTLTIGDNDATTLVAASATFSTYFGGSIRDGTGVVALTKTGQGTQTLSGANTYSGVTNITKGVLMAGAVNALSANSDVVLANDATVMLALTDGVADFSQVIKSLSGGGTVNLGTAAAADTIGVPVTRLTTGSTADTTYFGVIAGAGGLVKQGSGTFTLTGLNTYVGTTTVTAGNLQIGVAGVGQSGTGQTVVNAAATLSGTGFVQGATTVNGLLSAGDSAGSGIGKLTFTDLSSGSLSIASGGTSIAPRVRMTLGGSTGNENPSDGIQTIGLLNGAYGNHDHIQVQGGLILTSGSTFVVELVTGYSPTWGDVFNLIDWGTVTGTIDPGTFDPNVDLNVEVSATMLANGWFWEKNQFLTSGIIYVVPEPGRALLLFIAGLVTVMRRRRCKRL